MRAWGDVGKSVRFKAGASARGGLRGRRAPERGSEIVQTVIVLGFAVGLGAALMLLQGNIQTAITTAGTNITDLFSKVTNGAAK